MVPPFVGVAVNVADAPEHSGLVPLVSTIETDGVIIGFTVIVMEFDVTGFGLAHVAFDVITQVTTFPFASVVEVNVGLLVPTFVAPIFH